MTPDLGRKVTALLIPLALVFAGCGDTDPATFGATPDTTPPAVPTDVVLLSQYDHLAVQWAPNAEPDLAGYIVVRSLDAGETWEPLNETPLTETTFQDTKYPNVQYCVSAVDLSSNESAYSSPVGYQAPVRGPKNPALPAEPR